MVNLFAESQREAISLLSPVPGAVVARRILFNINEII